MSRFFLTLTVIVSAMVGFVLPVRAKEVDLQLIEKQVKQAVDDKKLASPAPKINKELKPSVNETRSQKLEIKNERSLIEPVERIEVRWSAWGGKIKLWQLNNQWYLSLYK